MNITTNRHLMVQIIQLCGKKGRITSNGNNKVVEFLGHYDPERHYVTLTTNDDDNDDGVEMS